jgi:hypothetical protein
MSTKQHMTEAFFAALNSSEPLISFILSLHSLCSFAACFLVVISFTSLTSFFENSICISSSRICSSKTKSLSLSELFKMIQAHFLWRRFRLCRVLTLIPLESLAKLPVSYPYLTCEVMITSSSYTL